jgi:hypothetical protein
MAARDHDVDDPSELVEALRTLHGHSTEGASFIERIFGQIDVGIEVSVPGVRLMLWPAGVIMLVAGALSAAALGGLRSGSTAPAEQQSRTRERSLA